MSNSSTIDVGDLSATVNKILDKYGDNVRKATGELIKLKSTPPAWAGTRRTSSLSSQR